MTRNGVKSVYEQSTSELLQLRPFSGIVWSILDALRLFAIDASIKHMKKIVRIPGFKPEIVLTKSSHPKWSKTTEKLYLNFLQDVLASVFSPKVSEIKKDLR